MTLPETQAAGASLDRRPKMWRREVLLASVAVPAFVNLVASLIAATSLGLEQFGFWLLWRSACQLTVALNPGFGPALTVLLPATLTSNGPLEGRRVRTVAEVANGIWGGLGTIGAAVVAFYVLDFSVWVQAGVVLLWSGMYLAGFTTNLARGEKDGRRLLHGGAADAVGGLLCIWAALLGNFPLFILMQAARVWGKAVVQYIPRRAEATEQEATPEATGDILRRILGTGLPLTCRGWVQTALQYGDRLLVGVVFGPTLVGLTGLGSMLALPSVMLSSTAAAWLLPVLIALGTRREKTAVLVNQLGIIGLASVGSLLLVPLLPHVVGDARGDLDLVVVSFALIAALGMIAPMLTLFVSEGRHWWAALLNGSFVAAIALVFLLAGLLSWGPLVTMVLSLALVTLGALALAVSLRLVPGGRVAVAVLVVILILGATTVFALYADAIHANLGLSAASAFGGSVLGLASLSRLLRRDSARAGRERS